MIESDGRQPLNVYLGSGLAQIKHNGHCFYISREGSGSSYVIGDYELFDFCGSGANSLVYKALSKTSGDIVIVKELFPLDLFENNEIERCGNRIIVCKHVSPMRETQIRERYNNAFTAEKSLGILRYTDELSESDRFLAAKVELSYSDGADESMLNQYLVTETAAGVTLDMLDLNRFTGRDRVTRIVKIIRNLTKTISILHEKGIIHLDLSQRNIFLRGDKWVLEDPENAIVALLDFGSSKRLSEEGNVIADTASFTASEDTASTEVKEIAITGSANDITTSSDVFSVCVILGQLLARDMPFYSVGDPVYLEDSTSVMELSNGERKELLRIWEKGQRTYDRYNNAAALLVDLDNLIEALEMRGVSRTIIRRMAEEKAKSIKKELQKEGFREDLLCSVERVDHSD